MHSPGAAMRLALKAPILVSGVLLASCVIPRPEPNAPQVSQPSTTRTRVAPSPRPLASPSAPLHNQTATAILPTAIPLRIVGLTEIRSPFYPGPYVIHAAFSDNAAFLYLALTSDSGALEWVSIDIGTGNQESLFPPPPVLRGHHRYAYDYPSLAGLVSPSNRFHLTLSDGSAPTAILVDLKGDAPNRRLVSDPSFGAIDQAHWSFDESLLVFSIYTPEFGADTFVTDTATGETRPLHELIGYEDHCPDEWQLSPDSASVALVDCGGELRIYTLAGKETVHLPGYFRNIVWSADSRYLYYYYGHEYTVTESLNAFDTVDSCEVVLLTEEDLAPLEKPGYWGRFWAFSPSPDGSQLLMWGRGAYLVQLRSGSYVDSCP